MQRSSSSGQQSSGNNGNLGSAYRGISMPPPTQPQAAPSPASLFQKPTTNNNNNSTSHHHPSNSSSRASSSGAVYRSLAVASSINQQDPILESFAALNVKKQPLQNKQDVNGIPRLPLPLELFPLAKSHQWLPDGDANQVVKNIETALKASMGELGNVELQRTNSTCRFECSALGPDMGESVNFAVNVFDAQGEDKAQGRFLVEAERTSGCPFLFHNVLESTLGKQPSHHKGLHLTPTTAAAVASGDTSTLWTNKMFHAPDLPSDIDGSCLCGQVTCNCDLTSIQQVLNTATSGVHEQRIQALCAIAEHCIKDKSFCRKLNSIDGAITKLKPLQTDPNPLIKRATQRIITSCQQC